METCWLTRRGMGITGRLSGRVGCGWVAGCQVRDPDGGSLSRSLALVDAFSLAPQASDAWDLRFTPGGESIGLIARSPNGKLIQLWNTRNGEMIHEIGDGNECSIDVSPHDLQLVTGDHQGRIRHWDAATGQLIREFSDDPGGPVAEEGAPRNLSVRFTQDATQIVSSSGAGKLQVWETESGALLHSKDVQSAIYASAFDLERERIVATWGTALRFWSLESDEITDRVYPPGCTGQPAADFR